jgi:CBS-domain-containing membrane protein
MRRDGNSTHLGAFGGAIGGAIAIGAMEYLSGRTAFPLMAIPFATSIVLVTGSPQAEPAQPRALVGGHIVSTITGLLFRLFGPSPWVAAVAVGLAILAMHFTDTFHPPAGIDPLVIIVNDLSWSFLFAAAGVGTLFLALFALIWHNILSHTARTSDSWPTRWW